MTKATKMANKPWFQVEEKSAGEKRLLLTYYIYKIFGVFPIYVIAFFVSFFTYLFSKDEKNSIKKFLNTLESYTNNPIYKYTFLKGYKVFKNYALSLVDKMRVFLGDFDFKNLIFENPKTKEKMDNYLKEKNGIFFLSSHLGNAEAIRSLLFSKDYNHVLGVNIFLEKNQCKIFNDFIKKISTENARAKTYPVEEISLTTSIEIEEKLNNGEIVFMSGDRTSKHNQNKVFSIDFLNKKINLPQGAFKFAYMLNHPIFFICAVKVKGKNKYKIYLKEFIKKSNNKTQNLLDLKKDYISFLESCVVKYPYQFYNFFDIFEDN